MIAALLFIPLLLPPPLAPAPRTKSGTFAFFARRGGHTAKVVFTVRPFDPARHKTVIAPDPRHKGRLQHTIDGRVPLGTDISAPATEIASLKFYFDGAQVPVPRRLYADCFNPPDFGREGVDSRLAVRFGDDGRSVFVFMCGSDAAGHYDVIWVLRPDGRHARFAGACGDCGFVDFHSGFFTLP